MGTPGEFWVSTSGFDSILPATAYTIVFGKQDALAQFDPLSGTLLLNNITYQPTLPNSGQGYYTDLNDSDAVPDTAAQGQPWYRFPAIHYLTGPAGFSDHSLDAGFCPDTLRLTACEAPPGSGEAVFDLPAAGDPVDPGAAYQLSWHASFADAQAGVSPLPAQYTASGQTVVFARLSHQGSGALAGVKMVVLEVLPAPVAYQAGLWACPFDSTGTALFNLPDADNAVGGGQIGITITYHTEYDDAYTGQNALPAQFSTLSRNIWVRVENAAGCFDIDFVSLTVTTGPQALLTPQHCTCVNGINDGSIDVLVSGGTAPYTFEWSNGVQYGPVNVAAYTLDSLPAGVYTLTLTDANGCSTVAMATVTAGSLPIAVFSISQEQACEGPFTVTFTDLSVGNPVAWNWTFPGGAPATSTDQHPVVTYAIPGIYEATLTVTNASGSNTLTLQVVVEAAPLPLANFIATVKPDGSVDFINLSQLANNYAWDFGDGATSMETDPTHTYTQKGLYPVTLTAFNICGSSDTTFLVNILTVGTEDKAAWLESLLVYPNPNTGAFTLEMIGKPEQEIHCRLYNTLGQLIKTEALDFSTGKLTHTFRYVDLPAAVYWMEIRAGYKVRVEKVVVHRR